MNFTRSSCAAAVRLLLALIGLPGAVPLAAQSSSEAPANDATAEEEAPEVELPSMEEMRSSPYSKDSKDRLAERREARRFALEALRDVDLREADVTPPRPPLGSIRLVSASLSISDRYGTKPFSKGATLCLAASDEVVLASVRVTFTVRGERCYTVADAEREAFEQEQGEADKVALYRAEEIYYAARKGGDPAEIERARENLIGSARRVPTEVERWRDIETASRSCPRCLYELLFPPQPPPDRPRSIIFRVASGSPDALARFPRGTVVQRSMSLCLRQGERMTVAANNGQTATYTGPGCLKRLGMPTRENLGAFVFG
jgi:hypothetical protein